MFNKKEDRLPDEKEYIGNSSPEEHVKGCMTNWESWGLPKDLWVDAFIHTLSAIP